MQLMGRACSRRIRHHGDSHCASASGCIDVGCQFRAWSGVASPGHCHRSGGGSDPFVFWYLTGTLRASGGRGCANGRRRRECGRDTRPVLRCASHGADHRRRDAVRNNCVTGAGGGSGCAAVEASLAIPSLHDSHPVVPHENRQGSSDGPRIATRYLEARHLGAL